MKLSRVQPEMFYASWSFPYTGPISTLKLDRDPFRFGLGHYRDEQGASWDIHGIVGHHVLARRMSDAPGYYSTATNANGDGFHQWIPYLVEVIG
jgi:hypothetical protein